MIIPSVNRRQFLATGSALVAATCVPDWTDAFQPVPALKLAAFTFTSISDAI
jgi:hypothetical protein